MMINSKIQRISANSGFDHQQQQEQFQNSNISVFPTLLYPVTNRTKIADVIGMKAAKKIRRNDVWENDVSI